MSAVTGSDVLREASFRVVRGDPTPDELAALVAVLTLTLRPCDEPVCVAPARAEWDRPADTYRSPLAWAA
ncbi:acyl-CoA carboxylase subunit epsilon [Streptomyces beijiangensis]|uniref:Acyl-CoA carboxylase subunit epsilon n=1 Tax=Streptomyces beijiangensis TaxID=163361 RepID=A0A939JDQ5_9ACTN|nr:acyl-CoA carboxylase subunit epsilon [Streptomyces beijiangensis]MBO0512266.1 acyl-CoA carboxylase subunit epsilon [Streptomyces beijiangensis]